MSELSEKARLLIRRYGEEAEAMGGGGEIRTDWQYRALAQTELECHILDLEARIAELEEEVTKGHELQDAYCDRIAELEEQARMLLYEKRRAVLDAIGYRDKYECLKKRCLEIDEAYEKIRELQKENETMKKGIHEIYESVLTIHKQTRLCTEREASDE